MSKTFLYNINASSGNLVATNVSVSSMVSTSITNGSLLNTNLSNTNLSSNNVVATNISAGTLSAQTITGANLSLSGNLVVGGTLTTVNITSTNMLNTNISAGTINATGLSSLQNVTATNISSSTLVATTSVTSGLLSATNVVGSNTSSGNLIATTATIPNIVSTNVTAANVNTGSVNASTGITTASLLSTGLISTANLFSTTATVPNIIGTNISIGTINSNGLTTGNINFTGSLYQNGVPYLGSQWTTTSGNVSYTTGSVVATNSITTNFSTGTLTATGLSALANATATNVSAGVVIASTGITTGTINATGTSVLANATATNVSTGGLNASGTSILANATATNVSTGGLNASGLSVLVNATATNVSAGVVIASTGITTAALLNTGLISTANLFSTTATIPNIVVTNISTGTLNASGTSVLVNATATNVSAGVVIASTGITTAALLNTGLISTANLFSTTATVPNIIHTNISTGTLNASGTSVLANATATNVSAGVVIASTGLTTGTINATGLSVLANVTASYIRLDAGTALDLYSPSQTDAANLTQTYIAFGSAGTTNDVSYLRQIGGLNSYKMALDIHDDGDEPGFCIRGVTSTDTPDTINERFTVQASGNVGINNSSPSANLDVVGTVKVSGTSSLANTTVTNISTGTLNASTGITAASAQITNENVTTSTIATLRVSSNLLALGNSNTLGNIYTTGGNVGIGITNPSNTLQIGNATNTNILTVTSSGSLGIGTPLPEIGFGGAIPNAKLTLLSAGLENVMTRLSIGSGSGHYSAIEGGHLTTGRTSLAFMTCLNATTNSGNPLTRMYIANDGNVGINTTSPSATLDVSGTIRATTSVTSGLLSATNVVGTSISAGTLSGTTITGANLSLSGNLIVGGTLTTVNITSTNMLNTNISAGTINATGLSSLANATATNVSTGGLNATGLSALANATVTNVSAGTLIASTGITAASAQISNENVTTSTIGTARITSALLALGNSNTLGNIFTTGGNVGINNSSPGEALDVRGNLRIGNSSQSNYISFYGTSGDEPGTWSHTYIGERIYEGSEKSELLLFKGNDISATASGPDRIRYLSANHVFDTYTSALSGTFAGVGTSGTTRMIIDQNGNVGINTTSPNAPLQLSNALVNRKIVLYEASNNDHEFFGLGINTGSLRYQSGDIGSHDFYTGTSSTTSRHLMKIRGDGYVGMGTTSPATALHVSNSTGNTMRLQNPNSAANPCLEIQNDNSTSYIGVGGSTYITTPVLQNNLFIQSSKSTVFTVNNGATTAMIMNTSGNVGIGTVTPNAPLQLSNAVVNRKIVLYDINNNDHGFFGLGINDASLRYQVDNTTCSHDFYAATSSTTSRHLLRISGDGNIGIGTTSPSGMLHLNNAALFTSAGNLTCTGDVVSFGSLSDRRLKKNIETIKTEKALDIVSKLRAVSFDWKEDIFNEEKRNTSDLGFIAQEVEELIPEAVSEYTQIESGEVYKNIKHERLVPYLLSAIQYLLSKQA